MAQSIKIRSGQVVKLELNDSCVDRLRAGWEKYSRLHELIHGSNPSYSQFISRMIMSSVDGINQADDESVMQLLIRIVSQ